MEYVELLSTGLKTIYTIAPSLLRLIILNQTTKLLFVVYRKVQRWVHSYFYFILMTRQIVPRNYHFEFLPMTQMCFTQVISYNILKQL